jgi:hypothetical protein
VEPSSLRHTLKCHPPQAVVAKIHRNVPSQWIAVRDSPGGEGRDDLRPVGRVGVAFRKYPVGR